MTEATAERNHPVKAAGSDLTSRGTHRIDTVIRPRGPWRDLERVEFATLEWVHWFNHRRILAIIGNRPPAQAEAAYHRPRERGVGRVTRPEHFPEDPARFTPLGRTASTADSQIARTHGRDLALPG